MGYKYRKQNWEDYNNAIESFNQPNAVITRNRLNHMEQGIERNSMELITTVSSDYHPSAVFREDSINKRISLDITFPILKMEPASNDTLGGICAKARTDEDMEVVIGKDNKLYTGILRSPDGSKFKLAVDDLGKLSTEKVL